MRGSQGRRRRGRGALPQAQREAENYMAVRTKDHAIETKPPPPWGRARLGWCVVGLLLVVPTWCLCLAITTTPWTSLWTTDATPLRHLRASTISEATTALHFNLSGMPASQVPLDILPYYSPPFTSSVELPHNINNNNQTNNLLHFVHTRFMQEQGNLIHLAWARVYLFEIFCLPAMEAQTTNNFFWLIRFDPELDGAVLHYVLNLTAHLPHVYWIASNHNFRINANFVGAWRDDAQGADLRASRIYSGHPDQLTQALAKLSQVLILDTRLDADDGLHPDYLRTVQDLALRDLASSSSSLKWKYWCARRHLAWHWMLPSTSSSDVEGTTESKSGMLTGAQTDLQCITPGITVGFPIGVLESDVPVFAHHELVQRLAHLAPEKTCTKSSTTDKQECLEFVQTHAFEAIRSRTPTSAGMWAVAVDWSQATADTPDWVNDAYWNILTQNFHLSLVQIQWVQAYLTRHLGAIGQDNLRGQCTTGHSCKPEAKRDLERLVQLATT